MAARFRRRTSAPHLDERARAPCWLRFIVLRGDQHSRPSVAHSPIRTASIDFPIIGKKRIGHGPTARLPNRAACGLGKQQPRAAADAASRFRDRRGMRRPRGGWTCRGFHRLLGRFPRSGCCRTLPSFPLSPALSWRYGNIAASSRQVA